MTTTLVPGSRHEKNVRLKVGVNHATNGETKLKEPQNIIGKYSSVCLYCNPKARTDLKSSFVYREEEEKEQT